MIDPPLWSVGSKNHERDLTNLKFDKSEIIVALLYHYDTRHIGQPQEDGH